jgi:Choline dehydrogenase and related flavoproteins
MNDRELYWPRGKTLGGSSSVNAMIYIRGHPHDYDTWAERGNEGWGYDDVLPYFRRAETLDSPRGDPEYHGTDGPLNVADPQDPRPLAERFVDAASRPVSRATGTSTASNRRGRACTTSPRGAASVVARPTPTSSPSSAGRR